MDPCNQQDSIRTVTHVILQTRLSYYFMPDRVHPAKYLSTSSQFILLDATSTRDRILLTAWCPPPQPNLPAKSRPVCYVQETDFALELVDLVRRAQKTQLAFRHPPTQSDTDTASHCSIAELCVRAAAACPGAQRGCSRGHRSQCAVPLQKVQTNQQQSQGYQASSLSTHLQYHTKARLWAIQLLCSYSH